MRNSLAAALASALIVNQALAASFHHSGGSRSTISLRKRLHVNTLITEPGTVEVEWDNLYSYTSGNFSMPSILKYTPKGTSIIWGRTEYSVAFDSVDSAPLAAERSLQFSDRLTLAATSVLFDGEKLDIAIAPQATFFLRDESGARLGATAIARYDVGRNSFGVTTAWGAATHSSPANPSGTWDFGGGFGRRLAAQGVLGHFTPHVNVVMEKSTGTPRALSTFGGIEYQITDRVAVDVTGQRLGQTLDPLGGGADRQVVAGVTLNFGKVQ